MTGIRSRKPRCQSGSSPLGRKGLDSHTRPTRVNLMLPRDFRAMDYMDERKTVSRASWPEGNCRLIPHRAAPVGGFIQLWRLPSEFLKSLAICLSGASPLRATAMTSSRKPWGRASARSASFQRGRTLTSQVPTKLWAEPNAESAAVLSGGTPPVVRERAARGDRTGPIALLDRHGVCSPSVHELLLH